LRNEIHLLGNVSAPRVAHLCADWVLFSSRYPFSSHGKVGSWSLRPLCNAGGVCGKVGRPSMEHTSAQPAAFRWAEQDTLRRKVIFARLTVVTSLRWRRAPPQMPR